MKLPLVLLQPAHSQIPFIFTSILHLLLGLTLPLPGLCCGCLSLLGSSPWLEMLPFAFWHRAGEQGSPRGDSLGMSTSPAPWSFSHWKTSSNLLWRGEQGQKGDLSQVGMPVLLSSCPLIPALALLMFPELVAPWGFVSVHGLTRPSELPHKHKHQRAGMCVFL